MQSQSQDVTRATQASQRRFLLVGISLASLLVVTGLAGAAVGGSAKVTDPRLQAYRNYVDNDALFAMLPAGRESVPLTLHAWRSDIKDWHPSTPPGSESGVRLVAARGYPPVGAMSAMLGKTQNPECITVAPGDTLSELLTREAGLPAEESRQAIAAIERIYPAEKLQPGQRLQFAWAGGGDFPLLAGLTLELDDDHHVKVQREHNGFQARLFSPADAVIDAETDTILAMVEGGASDDGHRQQDRIPRFLTDEWKRANEDRGN